MKEFELPYIVRVFNALQQNFETGYQPMFLYTNTPVLNKPYGFCAGRQAPCLPTLHEHYDSEPTLHATFDKRRNAVRREHTHVPMTNTLTHMYTEIQVHTLWRRDLPPRLKSCHICISGNLHRRPTICHPISGRQIVLKDSLSI